MLKFLKTTVAEDAITTEEIRVAEDVKADLEAKEAVHLQEEKAEETVVSEAIEVRLLEEKAEEMEVLEVKEVMKEAVRLQEEKADFLTELQDVLKVLEIHQDQEDQEEANDFR